MIEHTCTPTLQQLAEEVEKYKIVLAHVEGKYKTLAAALEEFCADHCDGAPDGGHVPECLHHVYLEVEGFYGAQ
jgi:hypothetical protein